MLRLTRIRVEASSHPSDGKGELERFLIDTSAKVRSEQGGTWVEEEPGVDIQTTKTGYWGRLTIHRVNSA